MKKITAQVSANSFSLGNGNFASGLKLLASNTGGYSPHHGTRASSGTETWRTRSNIKTGN
tara:strand:- start:424 stop:603 length:180 start_codon:yes stop_codon:yes gene_type:complete